ncbi:MAG: hypothetical protein WDZ46_02335 [Solirubrobacterales bacterium]
MLLLPPGWGAAAVVVGFLAGAGFERYRQEHLPLPPSLAETPSAWWWKLRDEIGIGPALAAAVLIVAAILVISLSITGHEDRQAEISPAADAGVRAGPVPDLAIRRQPSGVAFEAGGASFDVAPAAGAAWAAAFPAPPDTVREWYPVVVEATATTKGFDPAELSFRLADGRGALYYPDQQGTVGPASLARSGSLPAGASAEVRLGFLVPAKTEELALEFEPRVGGPSKVSVSLP